MQAVRPGNPFNKTTPTSALLPNTYYLRLVKPSASPFLTIHQSHLTTVSTFLYTNTKAKTVNVEFVPGTNELEDSAQDVEIDTATEISMSIDRSKLLHKSCIH